MRPYHPANLKYLPYARWRIIALAWAGKVFGVHFHVQGIPFGATYRPSNDFRNEAIWQAGRQQGQSIGGKSGNVANSYSDSSI